MKDLKKMFSPKSIAIVGASPKKGKLGNVLLENIKKGGWKGKLYLVNPKYAKSQRDYFSNLREIGKPVDLVLVAIPAPFVNGILEDGALAKPDIKNFAVISSGFKETGREGAEIEQALKKIADKYGLNVLGPNCLGFANPAEKLNATFTDVRLREGSVAIISQSGALAVALLDWAEDLKIGFSKIISIGNKADLEESEIIRYLALDKKTKAIALYLEDIKNGPNFMEALAKNVSRKPVVILKAGKTAVGQKAVSSHTGSLAQDEEIIEAVFDKMNVVPANNIEVFQDIIHYFNFNPVPAKNEVIIVSNAGGPGVMASDFIGKSKNIKLLDFPAKFKDDIKKYLPASASTQNPIDVIGDASPERYEKTLARIAKYFPKNPVLIILTPQNQTDPEKVAQILVKFRSKIENMSACFLGGEKIAGAKAILEKNKVLFFENPERALLVIEKLSKYFFLATKAKQSRAFENIPGLPDRGAYPALERAPRNDIGKAIAEKRGMLFWSETEKLFSKFQVKLANSVSFENIADLQKKKITFPCALKADDPNIAHRLEKNAVVLDIRNKAALAKSFGKMKKTTGASHFLVQQMAGPGLEMIIGMKNDSTFGPVILCGWGGSFTEIFRDKVILLPPLGRKEIENKLAQLSIFPILKGFRGKRGYNLGEISKIIATVAQIAAENPQIREIDINPLVVYNDGKAGKILDAKIFLM